MLPRETPLARPTDRWANDVECFMQMAKRGSSCPVRGPSNRPATRLRYGGTIFARGMTIQPHEEHCVQTKQKPRIIPNPCFPFYVCQDVHCRRPCTAPPPRCSLLTRPAFVSPPPTLSGTSCCIFVLLFRAEGAGGEAHRNRRHGRHPRPRARFPRGPPQVHLRRPYVRGIPQIQEELDVRGKAIPPPSPATEAFVAEGRGQGQRLKAKPTASCFSWWLAVVE